MVGGHGLFALFGTSSFPQQQIHNLLRIARALALDKCEPCIFVVIFICRSPDLMQWWPWTCCYTQSVNLAMDKWVACSLLPQSAVVKCKQWQPPVIPFAVVAIPKFVTRLRNPTEKQLMEPARVYIEKYLVPKGVLAIKVPSRKCLVLHDQVSNVLVKGKTDFLLVEESAARRILGPQADVASEPLDAVVTNLLESAVLGLIELKTPRETGGEDEPVLGVSQLCPNWHCLELCICASVVGPRGGEGGGRGDSPP